MNREVFFDKARSQPFSGHLIQDQVDGISAVLDEWDRRGLTDKRWLAYMLATDKHETASTMQPIREFGKGRGKRYGLIYYGRGLVQLTWDYNYRKASIVTGVDLIAHPDKALELPIAVHIMFDGMIVGWFTGRKLSDYIHGDACNYYSARRVINGFDRAALISGYAEDFQAAIDAASTKEYSS